MSELREHMDDMSIAAGVSEWRHAARGEYNSLSLSLSLSQLPVYALLE
jgi:hypothetical protein